MGNGEKRQLNGWYRRCYTYLAILCGAAALLAIFWQGHMALAQNAVLYWGSSGPEVKKVQARLNGWGYYHGPIDGYYSGKTQEAVKDFQRNNGINPDGVVGSGTWLALGYSSGGQSASYVPQDGGSSRGITNRDSSYLLARVIEGEAADEPYVGKVAVGAVILNRTQSASFPGSLAGVIYQAHAFESVSNGHYTRPVTEEALRAAQEAMSGWDPTGGALYFWNPSKSVSPWIWSRNITGQIGRHVFGY
ncbi:spore cortex-lytic enzyme, lytic transglycosylase SleB [Desulfocucumis palustris]|uniref:Spore cortex-lytic enzyme n=1 Tax=Desulfocucumis palustris TaxID=1898651 RepID=A0A2L2XHK1_9FIRM|nr:spore cortex-lytic enzyme, lytic transglycosylase SleB [Desulfocucumis palustris]